MKLGDMSYGELLESLRKDLQLDASTDILNHTVVASKIGAIPAYSASTQAANAGPGYWLSDGAPFLAGGMVADVFNNGARVPMDGLYDVQYYIRGDNNTGAPVYQYVQAEVWDAGRAGTIAIYIGTGLTAPVGVATQYVFSMTIPVLAGQYVFVQNVGAGLWYGKTVWPGRLAVTWRGPLS